MPRARMVTILVIAAGLSCVALGLVQDATQARAVDPRSYGVGFALGESVREELRRDGVEAALDLVFQGMRDGLREREPTVSRDELESLLAAVHEELQRRAVARLLAENPEFSRLHDANLETSHAFHAAFGAKPGVVTLPSGVQYLSLRDGRGRSPRNPETVVVSYRISRLDGTVVREGSNQQVVVGDVIAGGAEILRSMRVGAKWQFAIPPALAHGALGRYPLVGPNETLVGIIELHDVYGVMP